jgi:hypothetical protein
VSLLVLLLLDDVEDNSLLLDRFLELGMVSIDGTVMNSDEPIRWSAGDRESLGDWERLRRSSVVRRSY